MVKYKLRRSNLAMDELFSNKGKVSDNPLVSPPHSGYDETKRTKYYRPIRRRTMDALYFEGESKFTEYKQVYTKTLLKTVSAYANYHDGQIVIGINDKGEEVGVEDIEETRLSIENAINDALEPKPFYEITNQVVQGKK